MKLSKVKASKPERSYILGSTDGGKAKLAVEVKPCLRGMTISLMLCSKL